jgi:putative serine protease PepD
MSTPTNDENQNVPQAAPDSQQPQSAQEPTPTTPSTPPSSADTAPQQVQHPSERPTQQFARPVPPPPAPQPQYGEQPYAQQPYGQQASYGQPYAQPQTAQQPAAQNPYGALPQEVAPATKERKPRVWLPVTVAAVVAAALAAGGTAAIAGSFDSDSSPSSIASIGQQSSGQETVPVSGSTSENPNWEKVTSTVSKSVVAISVTLSNGEAEGSGVVLDTDGHILTNNHVVSGASNNTVTVTLSDGRIYKAKIVGTDPTTDLAVVKLQSPPSDLAPATLGDSSQVTTGESVLAVGNPLGLANTATTGIVSAINRPVTTTAEDSDDSVVTNALQIDAAINPGNSGGPLFNAQGQVVGITSSIATLSGSSSSGDSESGSIGLGFAIPINVGKDISSQLIKSGSAEHALLGVSLQDGTATADGVTRNGAKVASVTSGAPADKGGVKVGDVIVAIDGQPTPGADSLTGFVRAHDVGDTVKLTLVRGGKSMDVTVKLAEMQKSTQSGDQSGNGSQGDQGNGDGSQGDQGNGDGSDQNPFGLFDGGGN